MLYNITNWKFTLHSVTSLGLVRVVIGKRGEIRIEEMKEGEEISRKERNWRINERERDREIRKKGNSVFISHKFPSNLLQVAFI